MAKIKIHEIAKKIGLTSKEIIEKANELGINVKSHLSSIEDEQAEKIEKSLANKKESKKNDKDKNQGKEKSKSKDDKKDSSKDKKKQQETPVIIRREVIVSEAEPEEKSNKKQENKNNIGFVERNKNKNYNIVYRNKQQKPLTVSELFGIKDKKKEEEERRKAEEEKKKAEEAQRLLEEQKRAEEQKKAELQKQMEAQKQEELKIANEKNVGEKNIIKEKTEKAENKNMDVTVKKEFSKNENNYDRRNNMNNRRNNEDNKFNNENRENRYNGNNRYNNRNNSDYRNNDNRNNTGYSNNRYNRNDRYNNGNNNNDRYNNNNGDRRFNNRNGNQQNNRNNNGYNNGGYNNRYNNNNNRNGNRPLDEKGIDKNIKNIMSTEIVEKESQRDYTSKSIDKAKQNKFEESKANNKKPAKSRRQDRFSEIDDGKLKDLKQVDRLSHMFDEQDGGMLDYYDLTTQRGRRGKKKQSKGQEERTKQKIFQLTEITIPESITVKDLAAELKKTSAEVIKKLLGYGIMATLNNELDFDTAFLVAEEFGVKAVKKETVTEEDILFDDSEDKEEELQTRPPVIVVMGHVDHGKTSLLDAVRKTNVIEGEAGGITQAIGAYKVKVKDREITFLDTPGHEAFTAMRARGAQITDIAILVVAANDGVMPQTIEAINHAKSAGIPIIVAVNKMDLPDANIDKVKQELMAYDLVPEEWGGDTIYVPISAKKNQNIDQLLEMVLLEADVLELKANPHKQAKGTVIEARLDKHKGAIATMLVQRGSLDVGDTIVVGSSIGRIRSMLNDKGKKVKSAGPSTPVEISGLTEVPQAGDTFYEVKDEKMAKHLIERRKRTQREKAINANTKVTLDNLFSQMEEGKLKQLNLIVKADVQGSVEAVKQSLEKLQNEEVKVKVIHAAAGAVNESDVSLAKVSNAIIIAFNVRPIPAAKEAAEKDEVEIKQYSIIYQAIEDVEAAMKGMLDPEFEEKIIGTAEVRETFKISNVGTIAGSFVLTGKMERNAGVRVIRDNVVIHDGHLATLKRFKDDAKEVSKGFECGIQIENYNDIKVGDIIEAYVMEEIKR